MQKILIADRSDDICFVLKKLLEKEYDVTVCYDGETALSLVQGIRPDALILDLRLPKLDGFTLLSQLQGQLPPAVLASTDISTDYDLRIAVKLGAGHVLQRPFHTRSVLFHIKWLLYYARDPVHTPIDPRSIVSAHLTRLGLDCSHDGYQQLRLGIPLFMQDTSMHLGKELYPAIISIWGRGDSVAIERTIRSAIEAAWKKRDAAIWAEYFPDCKKCPNNKKFIARLSEFTQHPEN